MFDHVVATTKKIVYTKCYWDLNSKHLKSKLFLIANFYLFKGMKDTAPGPDGIPYSVYGKFWTMAGPLVLKA